MELYHYEIVARTDDPAVRELLRGYAVEIRAMQRRHRSFCQKAKEGLRAKPSNETRWVVCRRGDVPVGLLQIIMPRIDGHLPIYDDFVLPQGEYIGNACQIGQLFVSPAFRSQSEILRGLLFKAYMEISSRGIGWILIKSGPGLEVMYAKMGLKILFKEPRIELDYGLPSIAFLGCLKAMHDEYMRRWQDPGNINHSRSLA